MEESEAKEGAQGVAKAVQVVLAKKDHTFELNKQALEDILMQDHVKDRHVVVVSVAGAFRKGKSFLLDFFLKYMNAQGAEDWLGEEESPLDGFSWRGALEKDTTGIRMWSEVFLVDLPTGEKVAVVLMETAGDFDNEIAVRECAPIFALSTICSSVQIYNLSQNIEVFDLQHMQIFTEYSQLAFKDYVNNPFQKLQILIGDWSYPYEAKYGSEGGQQIFDRKLKVLAKQQPELHLLGRHITSCFKDISCFLMPHPGLQVSTNPNFDGRLKDIDTDFKLHLSVLVPLLLAPENLVIKEIGGQKVKANELFEFFIKSYTRICKGSELPEPQPMMDRLKVVNLAGESEVPNLQQQQAQTESNEVRPVRPWIRVKSKLNRNMMYVPVLDGLIFGIYEKKTENSKIFKCSQAKTTGCPATVETDCELKFYLIDPATTAVHTCNQIKSKQITSEKDQGEENANLEERNKQKEKTSTQLGKRQSTEDDEVPTKVPNMNAAKNDAQRKCH
ncbi:atlastin-like isoform X2 [Neocloeon triangulifer]|uniref:atlastin-like isoform X2 n=1 Tax=Neocloeon triangulifer TaxID=2078957 RepID=UPI00286EB52A|nr:atlastin-like isoform X2 [Neocloeon triangulifer]